MPDPTLRLDRTALQSLPPVGILELVWSCIPTEEVLRFLTRRLTPQERQQLLVLGWDTDPEEAPPFPFRYAMHQRVQPWGKAWVGTVVERWYRERSIFGPVITYVVEAPSGMTLEVLEPDLDAVE